MAWYRFLADAIVVLHAAWVGVVVIGMLAILVGLVAGWQWVRNFCFRTIHLAMIGMVVVLSIWGADCPLTVWENRLRARAGETAYAGSFIGYWAHELIFFEAAEWVFPTVYVVFGALVVVTFIAAPPRWPWKGRAAGEA